MRLSQHRAPTVGKPRDIGRIRVSYNDASSAEVRFTEGRDKAFGGRARLRALAAHVRAIRVDRMAREFLLLSPGGRTREFLLLSEAALTGSSAADSVIEFL